MKSMFSTLLFLVVISSPIQVFANDNKLPPAAADALQTSGKVILYSLEPWSLTTNHHTLTQDLKFNSHGS
jgi:hypothetical protein